MSEDADRPAAESGPPHGPGFDRRMLEALVCPVTRGMLIWDEERQELISKSAGYAFPVREGIPIMLIDEARRLDD
ncbi:MAG: Trm112 family protein [Alphaproteobacteria bacterium]|nr:MAG: Trm112 family protein [Alphaproteobacteria bacterium]